MSVFSKSEFKILSKFKNWNIINESDVSVLNTYSNIGFVRYTFDWDNMVSKAKLTDLGLAHLNK